MANQIPFSGAANASGGFLLPPEQGAILVNGILIETGAIQLAGDARATTARKTNFPIWLGRPTAGPVGEGAAKPVTGAAFGQASLNIKKFASIVIFTDEQIQDLQNGDLSVLVDAGVRQALSVSIDGEACGLSAGAATNSVFDDTLVPHALGSEESAPASVVILENTTKTTGVQKAVSAALGILEENGYGNPADAGVLLGFGFQKMLRDVRDGFERPVYDGGSFAGQTIDALYGLTRAHSTNLATTGHVATTVELEAKTSTKVVKIKAGSKSSAFPFFIGQPISDKGTGTEFARPTYITAITGAVGAETELTLSTTPLKEETIKTIVLQPVGIVVHKPNLHVRIREDVVIKTSNEASIVSGETTFNLFQENLTAVLYETRIGFLVHDLVRAVIPIWF